VTSNLAETSVVKSRPRTVQFVLVGA